MIAVIALIAGISGDGDTSGDDRRPAAVAGGGPATPAADADSKDGSTESEPSASADSGETSVPGVAPLSAPTDAPANAGTGTGVGTGVGTGAGVEVLPLEEEEEAGLPASEKLPQLLQDPAPTAATSTGRRVAGLPDVISPAPESTLTSSAVGVAGQTVTASLDATTSAAGAEILDHYVRALGAVGLSGTPATMSGGTTVQTFYRGNDSVAVTIATASGGVTAYTLRGLFAAIT